MANYGDGTINVLGYKQNLPEPVSKFEFLIIFRFLDQSDSCETMAEMPKRSFVTAWIWWMSGIFYESTRSVDFDRFKWYDEVVTIRSYEF